MDPLYKPLTQGEKNKLEERGLKEWEYFRFSKWADPDTTYYHGVSALILAGSIYGRHWARKNFLPCGFWTMNIIAVPILYFLTFKFKHVNSGLTPFRPRPSFNECLENYPITRRAWKRALAIRANEMKEIKQNVGEVSH